MDATLSRDGSVALAAPHVVRPNLDAGMNARTALVFFSVLAIALFFIAYSIYADVQESGVRTTTYLPYVLLGVTLFVALGFEFVNGFHDTANAVATVIYTHSLPAQLAVMWSGLFNFLGVLASSGAVAYGIVALLPVELILQVGSSAGFAMVFALLIGAIIWNLGTWYLGLPASSSHTLIGSIIGVGLANRMMASGSARAASTGPRHRRSDTRCCSHRSSAFSSRDCSSSSSRRLPAGPSCTQSLVLMRRRHGGSEAC
jgi:PiT family inorganic phosphate transporter